MTEHELGRFEQRETGVALHFARHVHRPIEAVWAALTEPDKLSAWLGAALVEPHAGGRFELFIDRPDEAARMLGRVVTWEPPRRLDFTWTVGREPETRVGYRLEDDGPNATKLAFTHGDMAFRWLGLVLPGWHALFERLAILLERGEATQPSMDRWRALQKRYIDHYRLEGVLVAPPAGHDS